MKPRKSYDLRELTNDELKNSLTEAQETLSSQRFQHALAQLQDTAYLNVIRKDIAKIKTIIKERQIAE